MPANLRPSKRFLRLLVQFTAENKTSELWKECVIEFICRSNR